MNNSEEKISAKEYLSSVMYVIGKSMRYASFLVLPIVVLQILKSIIPVVAGYISKLLVNELSTEQYVSGKEHGFTTALIKILIVFCVFKLVPVILESVNDLLILFLNRRMRRGMTLEFVTKYLDKISAIAFQDAEFNRKKYVLYSNGNIASVMLFMIYLAGELAGIAATTVAMWSVYPWLSLLILAIIPYTIFALKFIPDFFQKMLIEEGMMNCRDEYREPYFDVNKLGEMKIFKNSGFFEKKLDNTAYDWAVLNKKLSKQYQGIIPYIPIFAVTLIKMAATLFIVYLIFVGKAEIGDLVLFASVSYVFNSYGYLFERLNSFSMQIYDVSWFRKFVNSKQWQECVNGESVNPGKITNIRFEHVCFSYRDTEVLHDINLDLDSGTYLAIVGLNGSGKTTLVKLMCGLYTPTSGTIYYNGIPHDSVDINEVRRQMAVVSQTYCKYGITFSENITFGHKNKVRFEHYADKLKLNELIDDKGGIYDSPMCSEVHDDGMNLSEGQWQRVAIARALYKEGADVLIMDEPAASLDAETENRILEYVSDTDRDYSIRTIITHRLSCVKKVNRIIVLENGSIVEDGTHDKLYSSKGAYYDLFSAQADKYMA